MTPMATMTAEMTRIAALPNRSQRQILSRVLARSGESSGAGWMAMHPAAKAPARIPRAPVITMGIPWGTTAPRSMKGRIAISGATIAITVGHFGRNPGASLDASQNWQNARNGAPTRHPTMISLVEEVPGTSTAEAATK